MRDYSTSVIRLCLICSLALQLHPWIHHTESVQCPTLNSYMPLRLLLPFRFYHIGFGPGSGFTCFNMSQYNSVRDIDVLCIGILLLNTSIYLWKIVARSSVVAKRDAANCSLQDSIAKFAPLDQLNRWISHMWVIRWYSIICVLPEGQTITDTFVPLFYIYQNFPNITKFKVKD